MKTRSTLILWFLFPLLAGLSLAVSSCEKASESESESSSEMEATESVAGETEPTPSPESEKKNKSSANPDQVPMKEGKSADAADNPNLETATLGGGCFWCTEAVLERVDGVVNVVSGYMGGHVENPTYEQITTKTTGHAEVIQVTYDKTEIGFADILDIFWQAHDPTTLNRQGNDRGPQYRSAIFYHSPEQKNIAEKSKAALDASGMYDDPAVTEITEASTFWEAEEYHQDYYVRNKDKNPYCRVVITPKMKKFGFE